MPRKNDFKIAFAISKGKVSLPTAAKHVSHNMSLLINECVSSISAIMQAVYHCQVIQILATKRVVLTCGNLS